MIKSSLKNQACKQTFVQAQDVQSNSPFYLFSFVIFRHQIEVNKKNNNVTKNLFFLFRSLLKEKMSAINLT